MSTKETEGVKPLCRSNYTTYTHMHQNIILTKKTKTANGTVQLTGSKSECNRALVIEALSDGKVKVENISDAADTVTLAGILKSKVESQKPCKGLKT